MVPSHSHDGHAALRAKAVHAIIDMPGREDDGYETDATAFTDGGYTSAEDEGPDARRAPATRLGAKHGGKPAAFGGDEGAHVFM